MSEPDDLRNEPRYSMVLRADFPDHQKALDATENLSASGVFVRTDHKFKEGEQVTLSLSFPGLLRPTELTGVVAWLRAESSESPAGVGVRIPPERAADREKLKKLVDALNAPPSAHPSAEAQPGFRVLIVEDNPHIVEMYAYVLKKFSREMGGKVPLEVAFAGDGHAALAQLKGAKFDLVMTDLYMPVLDGFGLVQRIREDAALKAIPVLVISAGGPEAQARANQLGVDVYLRKPVRFVEVLETVKGLLKIRGV